MIMRTMKNNNNETVMVIGIDHGYGNMKTARRTAEKEIQKLKKRMKLQSEKISEIKFFCGIGYAVAVVLAVCFIGMCFL